MYMYELIRNGEKNKCINYTYMYMYMHVYNQSWNVRKAVKRNQYNVKPQYNYMYERHMPRTILGIHLKNTTLTG